MGQEWAAKANRANAAQSQHTNGAIVGSKVAAVVRERERGDIHVGKCIFQ